MKKTILTALLAGAALFGTGAAYADHHEGSEDAAMMIDYAGILAADDRSAEDKERDASRHPAEIMELIHLKPGQMLLDIGAGSGYFAEAFARVLGNQGGMVHAINTPGTAERFPQAIEGLKNRAAALSSGKIISEIKAFEEVTAHKPADAVFMGQMYHEVIRQNMDPAAVNGAVYNALKPGGYYVIEIHNAVEGAGAEVSGTLHRADPAIVRAQVEAAGFELVEENTTLLGNPDDPKDVPVFNPDIRGNTDRTLFIFRKPE